MLPNEGLVTGDTQGAAKTEILRQLRRIGPTDPDALERAVFEALTGGRREDVDWELDDNQAGYYLWLRSFDTLLDELVAEGHVCVEGVGGDRRLLPPE
jgi:hypothetical protein